MPGPPDPRGGDRDREPERRRGRLTVRRVVVFDCDSTLTAIEGIDWLAERRGVGAEVAEMTAAAMAGEVPLEDVYARRLALVRPEASDLAALARAYGERTVDAARESIAALRSLGWEVWVVSGGLEPAVRPFAAGLGVEPERIRAVPYDPAVSEPWSEVARHPLATADGKRAVISAIVWDARRSVLVGDGASDLAARPAVDRFLAFTGFADRPAVRRGADGVIPGPSLAPVVPLVAGPEAGNALA